MKLDDPAVTSAVFHPRAESRGFRPTGIQTSTDCGGVRICGHLHPGGDGSPLLIFFHGNGETASDYDPVARLFTECGASFWAVDYRGYGRSGGSPSFPALFGDAESLLSDAGRIGRDAGRAFGPVIAMGRSLGSAPAIHLASAGFGNVAGLVLDSPFADGPGLIARIGGPRLGPRDLGGFRDNLDRMADVTVPVLIIHGTDDCIIPFSEAEALLGACRSAEKRLVPIAGAGHNDLLSRAFDLYFAEIKEHVALCSRSY